MDPARGAASGDQDATVGEQRRRVQAASVAIEPVGLKVLGRRVIAALTEERAIGEVKAPGNEDAAVGQERGGVDLSPGPQRAGQGHRAGFRRGRRQRRRGRCRRDARDSGGCRGPDRRSPPIWPGRIR